MGDIQPQPWPTQPGTPPNGSGPVDQPYPEGGQPYPAPPPHPYPPQAYPAQPYRVGPGPYGHLPAPPPPQPDPFVTGGAYGMLFMLGLMFGVVGGFQHAWSLAGLPLGAIAMIVLLFVLCFGAGLMMRSVMASFAVAVGWLVVSFLFSMPQSAGDLIIAGNMPGYIYLYGGAVVVLIAVMATVMVVVGGRARSRPAPRRGQGTPPGAAMVNGMGPAPQRAEDPGPPAEPRSN